MNLKVTRRNLLFSTVGFVTGTMITAAAGLTYREMRRRQYVPPPRRSAPAGDDGWLISTREREAARLRAALDTDSAN